MLLINRHNRGIFNNEIAMLTEVKKNTVKNILKKIAASIISQITSGVIPLSGSNANFDELSWQLLEVDR